MLRLTATFDPYSYILLNLFLSTLASVQAPLILMSQNRQAEKDRVNVQNDYEVNLKSELEIMMLHEKVDHLCEAQWQELLSIQNERQAREDGQTQGSSCGAHICSWLHELFAGHMCCPRPT